MMASVNTSNIEHVRIRQAVWIAVGGADQRHDAAAARNEVVAELDLVGGAAERALHRAGKAQQLSSSSLNASSPSRG